MLNQKIFFVFGPAKSGTTYLQMLLDSHPELSCPPEHRFIDLLKGLEQLLLNYNKLLEYGDQITARQGVVLFEKEDIEYIFAEIVKLAAYRGARGRKVKFYGLKDNHFVFWLPLVEKLFPEAKIVSPVRDPRSAVVSGWYFNLRINPSFRQTRGRTIELWAQDMTSIWKRDVEAILEYQKKHPKNVFIVRYEDLRTDPFNYCRKILDFLGVCSDKEIIKKILEKTSFEKLKDGRFFRKGAIDEWKKELTPQAIRIIEKLASPLMKRFGYSLHF